MAIYKLRSWQMEDAASIAPLCNNPKIAANLRDAFPHPYALEDAEEFIKTCMESDPERQLMRAIEVGGKAVGSIGIFVGTDVYCCSAELGYCLGEPYWGKGIMSCAVREICKDAFSQLDILRIYAEPFALNAGSRRVLEKAGFVLEGIRKDAVRKNGKLLDDCMYALLRRDVMEE